jgi:hypothetical protein
LLTTDRWLLIDIYVQDKLVSLTAQCDGLSLRTGVRFGVGVPELQHETTVGHMAALLVSVLPLENTGHLARFEALTAVLLKIRVV